jgi:hypothetical protein
MLCIFLYFEKITENIFYILVSTVNVDDIIENGTCKFKLVENVNMWMLGDICKYDKLLHYILPECHYLYTSLPLYFAFYYELVHTEFVQAQVITWSSRFLSVSQFPDLNAWT